MHSHQQTEPAGGEKTDNRLDLSAAGHQHAWIRIGSVHSHQPQSEGRQEWRERSMRAGDTTWRGMMGTWVTKL